MKRKAGSSTKFIPKTRKIIIDELKEGGSKTTACRKAGVHVTTYQGWIKKGESDDATHSYKKFVQDINEALEIGAQRHIERIQEGDLKVVTDVIKDPDGNIIQTRERTEIRKTAANSWKWLQQYRPDEYGPDKQIIEVQGNQEHPLTTAFTKIAKAKDDNLRSEDTASDK